MARMRKPKRSNPSFFKVLVGDFSTKLKVPTAFEKNLKGKKLPTTFKIWLQRSGVVKPIISSWNVKLSRSRSSDSDSGRYYCFTKGWSKLVKDLHLAEGDFLVFHLKKTANTFRITVYAPTCCEKSIRFLHHSSNGTDEMKGRQDVKVKNEIDDEGENREARNEKQSRDRSMRPRFEKTLAYYQLKFFTLPRSFIREAKLCNEKKVVIKDRHGKKWPVVMNKRTTNFKSERFDLVTGWSDFIRGNGIGVGDTLRFKYVKGCVIQVKVA